MVDRPDLTPSLDAILRQAADVIGQAEALLITAGAGMGVDSGLPDFRGPEGFWRAYPPYRKLGLHFQQLANPSTFSRDPNLAWGFYGHRLHLYRSTTPHRGFDVLLKWGRSKPGCFVFTSNVDGHFRAAGFPSDPLLECHGSIHHLQCTRSCCSDIWPADGTQVSIDADMRPIDPLPCCPKCGALARPNILLFGDFEWISQRSDQQEARYRHWLCEHSARRIAVIECGAGKAIPTVRHESESVAANSLIRINPREPEGPRGTISLPMGALEAIERIDALLGG